MNNRIFILFCSLMLALAACHTDPDSPSASVAIVSTQSPVSAPVKEKTISLQLSPIEEQFIAAGLVDIQKMDSSISVDLKYSTIDNFLEMDVYGDLEKAYLQGDVAEKLKKAQEILKAKYPYYSLIVFDAV